MDTLVAAHSDWDGLRSPKGSMNPIATCPLDKLAHMSGQPQVVKSKRFVTSTGPLMVPLTRLVAGESMPADTVFERVPTPHLAIAIIVTTGTYLQTSALPPGQLCPIGHRATTISALDMRMVRVT